MVTKIVKTINGVQYSLETGRLANLATAAILAQAGDTVILTVVAVGADNPDLDFFPLSVDYVEKMYSAGLISSSRFIKRETRPSDKEILSARLLDRSLRSLFPEDLTREVQIITQVLAYDHENDPEILQCIAASAALLHAGLPFAGPMVAVRSGMVDGKVIYFPSLSQLEKSEMNLVVSATKDAVVSIDADAHIVSDDILADVLTQSVVEAQPFLDLQNEFLAQAGVKSFDYSPRDISVELLAKISADTKEFFEKAAFNADKKQLEIDLRTKKAEIHAKYDADYKPSDVEKAFEKVLKEVIRTNALEKARRIDGRKLDELRSISAEVGVLPRVHGSAIFNRGETQVLSIVTLGSQRVEQTLEGIDGESVKRYMHHYNFPGYSVGEVDRKLGMANRRAIGHGMIGEKSIMQVLPETDKFKYTVRVVSEVLSSNGSTSMAATCGSTLALMDAGVQIANPVAGISMGLVYQDENHYVLFTDITGSEDHYGDMDFKVTGTRNGWTAIQLDNKLKGIPVKILLEALKQSKKIRLDILDMMEKVIAKPREELSKYAPRITSIKINQSKIGELIGPGGKMIKEIIAQSGAEINISDDGTVDIASTSGESAQKALDLIKETLNEIEPGTIMTVNIKKVEAYGVFVELSRNFSGLVHVSKMPEGMLKTFKPGMSVKVRYDGSDDQGRNNFSMNNVEQN